MKTILVLLVCTIGWISFPAASCAQYPTAVNRKISPGNTVYYIDPGQGSDEQPGKSPATAWKSFAPANQLIFSSGDQLRIIQGGSFEQSLFLIARGSRQQPVTIEFAPGRYNFYRDQAFKKTFHISNTNDVPDSLKAIALYIYQSSYVAIKGRAASLVMRGKLIEACIDSSSHIALQGLQYDYHRPTMSEWKVLNIQGHSADLLIHPDSRFSISDSLLTWEGEGWRHQPGWYWQAFDPATGELSRTDLKLEGLKYSLLGGDTVRIHFGSNPGLHTGWTYQNRDVLRDCAGMFFRRSREIRLQNIQIRFMHGMGVVAQFCENISIDSVFVQPGNNSGRTSAAWADILHFSGCKGKLSVRNSYLSAANDDAINVHGTHLRIVEQTGPRQVKLRFMHGQTYGFLPFIPGDSVEFIHAGSLLSYSANKVVTVQALNDKDYLLTLLKPVPAALQAEDVLENTTWTPELLIQHNTITRIPTRGVLISTRRKVVIEQNDFIRTQMSAILVADDAASWYESGMVRNVLIRRNNFIQCGEPVINIHPENSLSKGPVHKNISILDNYFELRSDQLVAAKSTEGMLLAGNRIKTRTSLPLDKLVTWKDCQGIQIRQNEIGLSFPANHL